MGRKGAGGARVATTVLGVLLVTAPSSCVPDFEFGAGEGVTCDNGAPDEGEVDIDCGGVCSPCPLGKRCRQTSDCADGSCIEEVCRVPACGDSSLSPGETDLDCGGLQCAPCGANKACLVDRDCESMDCSAGRCAGSISLGGGSGDGDGDLGNLGGDPSQLGSGGADDASGGSGIEGSGGAASGGASSGGAPSGGAGSGGAGSGGAASGGAGSGGAGSGGAGSGGAGSGGSGTGGSPASLCDQLGFAFCDDFQDGNASGWTPSGGTWTVGSEGTNFVYSGGSGSQESIAGVATWTDVRVEARMKVVNFGGTGSSYRAGIVARFSGPSDFFTFSFDATGYLRLLKSTGTPSGASGTCGSLSYPFTVGTWYDMRLEVEGGSGNMQLRTYINGVLQHDCHTTQTSVVAGKAGVLTVGSNTIATFDDVTVTLL